MLFRERQLMSLFKLGDWVISTKYPKASPVKIQHQHAIDTGIFGTYTNTKGQASLLYAEECKLWQPKPNEWCWFQWTQPKTAKYQILSKLKTISDNGYFYEDINGMCFEFCEPFIGQLPTLIKDQS